VSSRLKPIVWFAAALGLAGILYLLLAQRRELDSLRGQLAKLAQNSEMHQKAEAVTIKLPVRSFERSTPFDAPKLDSGSKPVVKAEPVARPPSDLTDPLEPTERVQGPGEQAFAEQQQSARVASQLDQVLEADVVDPAGDSAIRRGFEALRDVAGANSIRSLECRWRMCRGCGPRTDLCSGRLCYVCDVAA